MNPHFSTLTPENPGRQAPGERNAIRQQIENTGLFIIRFPICFAEKWMRLNRLADFANMNPHFITFTPENPGRQTPGERNVILQQIENSGLFITRLPICFAEKWMRLNRLADFAVDDELGIIDHSRTHTFWESL
ncbi:hypothetical protein CDAR_305141 [Caerostris darwini]|uniref:Uncharacterized protein n=1 Tax=Caerostris darwini TaxID=1538125 RepID=A0AAV4RGX8_9ARAC|nr:hypothetical protein CDAR_305141 [Caerostris darwini]